MEQQFKRTHLQKENARNRICTNKQQEAKPGAKRREFRDVMRSVRCA